MLYDGALKNNFYPRPPRGGRLRVPESRFCCCLFLSTPSARRATTCGEVMSMDFPTFLSTPSARRATGGLSLLAGG